ncbi:response regulator [Armatimonas sp.]|uniref:response regulator n=1 Tax=Armatimonas sp. TaxID=1872638 RepID=UPI0037539EA4
MTVLVVEDKQATRLLLQEILEKAGYQVLLTEFGETAKQILQETHVDAVIVSWALQARSGLELAHWIRQQPPRIGRQLVVIAVGNVSPVRDSFNRYPVDIFVPRPFNPTEILAFLKRLLSFEERAGIGNV